MAVNTMDSRRNLVLMVQEGTSLSEACRRSGVTRKTGRKWVRRAQSEGLSKMTVLSRAPRVVACRTPEAVEESLRALKAEFPEWGAKKLVVKLKQREGIVLAVRTADRVLSRFGLTTPRKAAEPELQRFERSRCGALLQMDFKGLPMSTVYQLLTVLDDSGRYCLMFGPLPDKRGPSVKFALWELFQDHGLPKEMLMDNGDCWGGRGVTMGPTNFEAWLMRLGVRPIHASICHPQTQGKVERFHETAKKELGDRLVQPTIELARQVCDEFVSRYNWERPHEALGQEVPGSRYVAFERKCPRDWPIHEIPEGSIVRKVDDKGIFKFKGMDYLIGSGLHREQVVLQEAEFGMRVFYAGFALRYLHELNHARSER